MDNIIDLKILIRTHEPLSKEAFGEVRDELAEALTESPDATEVQMEDGRCYRYLHTCVDAVGEVQSWVLDLKDCPKILTTN